jgi:hypothetical protein
MIRLKRSVKVDQRGYSNGHAKKHHQPLARNKYGFCRYIFLVEGLDRGAPQPGPSALASLNKFSAIPFRTHQDALSTPSRPRPRSFRNNVRRPAPLRPVAHPAALGLPGRTRRAPAEASRPSERRAGWARAARRWQVCTFLLPSAPGTSPSADRPAPRPPATERASPARATSSGVRPPSPSRTPGSRRCSSASPSRSRTYAIRP